VDLGLPDGYGGDLIKDLEETNSQAQVLVLGSSLDRGEIARAVEAGAAGVLDKSANLEEVMKAVRRLRAGETLMPLQEVVELLSFADTRRQVEHKARLASRYTVSGTHQGEFFGIPGSGKRIEMTGINIDRFDESGKLVEEWPEYDLLGAMQQMGAIPQTEQ
jgi:hypothetical protein